MLEPRRIAVVEDDLAILDTTNLLLAIEGYHPIGFTTAAAARAGIEPLQPALVIVDLHLERRAAGLDLVFALRRAPTTAAIPVLLWSADPILAGIVEQPGVDTVVVRHKPVLPSELLRLVADLTRDA